MLLGCGAVCRGEVGEGTMLLPRLSAGFQSLPPLPTSKLGPSDADSWAGGFVYILGPRGSLQQILPWGWEFVLLPQLPQVFFSQRFWGFYFPALEPWVVWSVSLPSCFSQFMHMQMWDRLASYRLAASLLCPSCLCPPLLPVWMNVSSLTVWLSDFHIVLFSVSSGYFLFLHLLLSFFCLCEETRCIYLCLHLGQKSYSLILYKWVSGYMVFIVQMGNNLFNQVPIDRQLVNSILFFSWQYICRHPFIYISLHTHLVEIEGSIPVIILFYFILFIFRERVREGEREGEETVCGCLAHVPY